MSVGSEFHRSDAATGKERRPTVVSWNQYTQFIKILYKLTFHNHNNDNKNAFVESRLRPCVQLTTTACLFFIIK